MATPKPPAPDPVVAPDAGQSVTVRFLDHIEGCEHENCHQETRLQLVMLDPANSYESEQTLCKDHIWSEFADWMVGA